MIYPKKKTYFMALSPAYGRTYLTKKHVQKAWEEDEDFLVSTFNSNWHGKLCRKSDLKRYAPEVKRVEIYYRNFNYRTEIEV